MKKPFFFLFLFVFTAGTVRSSAIYCDSKTEVYEVLQSTDTVKINALLRELDTSASKEKDAYQGALIMKKSGMVGGGLEKLSLFKKGRKMLEASIKADSSNAEYRFLRLIIQEHVPDFLNYHSKKQEDAQLIIQQFRKLSVKLQESIRDYSKNSHLLKPEDFQK